MGLVSYESSDEDDEVQEVQEMRGSPSRQEKSSEAEAHNGAAVTAETLPDAPPAPTTSAPPKGSNPVNAFGVSSDTAKPASKLNGTGAPASSGPRIGPARPPPEVLKQMQLPEAEDEDEGTNAATTQAQDPSDPPRSPYSASRALLHHLTFPAVPNTDIPPSPPGSPPPHLEALNAKFDNFLKLKRTQGVHFNQRLAGSAALRNPGLMDKLLGFVGVETTFDDADGNESTAAATEQYATTLPADLWDPAAFPPWAYRGPLRRAQERGHRERERAKGEPLDFVASASTSTTQNLASRSASAAAPASNSRTHTPSKVAGKRKTRFDT
ncbi:HCNGP-like protein-domain-containing protein [Diplogelasinospora grovesii]|uniref:HCNGP-like protein-domain-containing protein n=1 Tax=Diplogelasinospora grovesii TaxID=303347 RepID=A0AAN6S2Y4_9PEZI|nr:HCNGP-like protein-domain-containing protein [Diplogelasinospora grovesii]